MPTNTSHPQLVNKTPAWGRRLAVVTLLAALATTGGLVGQQPDQAPSTGDLKPRCC